MTSFRKALISLEDRFSLSCWRPMTGENVKSHQGQRRAGKRGTARVNKNTQISFEICRKCRTSNFDERDNSSENQTENAQSPILLDNLNEYPS